MSDDRWPRGLDFKMGNNLQKKGRLCEQAIILLNKRYGFLHAFVYLSHAVSLSFPFQALTCDSSLTSLS